jgi:hypothetical protein
MERTILSFKLYRLMRASEVMQTMLMHYTTKRH